MSLGFKHSIAQKQSRSTVIQIPVLKKVVSPLIWLQGSEHLVKPFGSSVVVSNSSLAQLSSTVDTLKKNDSMQRNV